MGTTRCIAKDIVPSGASGTTNAILFDVNVWLDYFFARAGVVDDIAQLLEAIACSGDTVATTVSIKKDLFYIVPREAKRRATCEHPAGSLETPSIQYGQIAWDVLEFVDELATIVPQGLREDFFARHLKDAHGDYEDATLIATAQAIGAKCVVTSDVALLRHFPDECMTPSKALGLYR